MGNWLEHSRRSLAKSPRRPTKPVFSFFQDAKPSISQSVGQRWLVIGCWPVEGEPLRLIGEMSLHWSYFAHELLPLF